MNGSGTSRSNEVIMNRPLQILLSAVGTALIFSALAHSSLTSPQGSSDDEVRESLSTAEAQSRPTYRWTISPPEQSIDLGESVQLGVRIFDVTGSFDNGGVSVSFPSLTSVTGDSHRHISSQGDVTVRSTSGGVSNVIFYERDDEIFSFVSNRQIPASHLLVESHNASWISSSDRTVTLTITPKQAGRFEIRLRTWLCQNAWDDCIRGPSSPDTNDQQSWGVRRIYIDVNETTTAEPDLAFDGLPTVDGDPAPSEFTVGDTVTIESVVRNIGDGPAGRSDLAYYLGSTSGHRFDTDRVGSLDPGETDNNSESYTFVDDDIGTQYFILDLDSDSEVDELAESNNTAAIGPFTVHPREEPASYRWNWSLSDSSIELGESVQLDVTIHDVTGSFDNGGVSVSFPSLTGITGDSHRHISPQGDVTVRSTSGGVSDVIFYERNRQIYASDNQPISADELLVESHNASWSSSSDRTVSLTIVPKQAGRFEIRVRAALCQDGWDDCITQPSRSDTEDQQRHAVKLLIIDVRAPSKPDLAFDATPTVDGNPVPTEFTVGDTVTIESIVRNIGDGPAGRSDLAYYLGSTSGHRFDTDRVGSLDPGETDNNSESYTFVDDDIGTQYFILDLDSDSEVDELAESNNTAAIGPFTVHPREEPASYRWNWSLSDSSIELGESVQLDVTIHDVTGSFDNGGVSVSFPSLTGITGDSHRHISPQGDVTVRSTSGGVSDVIFYERNRQIYASDNQPISADELLVESHNASWSSSSDRTVSLTIVPKQAGRFEIRLRTWLCQDGWDDCITQPSRSDTEDQQGHAVKLLIIDVRAPSKPDLAFDATPTVDGNPVPTEFTVGDTVTIESTVRNIGDGAAGRSDLAYYLGSASGRRLDTGRVGSLDPGDTDNNSESYTFVDDDVGTQYFTIVIDFDSEVDELDESNNTAVIGPFTVHPREDPASYGWDWSLSASSIELGESVQLDVTIHDVTGSFDNGGVSVSFPSLTSITGDSHRHISPQGDVTVRSTSGGRCHLLRTQQSQIYASDNQSISADELLVESHNASWSSSSDRTVSLTIVPKQAGRFEIRLRTWLCQDGWDDCITQPSRSDTEDQQGHAVKLLIIDVRAPSKPDLAFDATPTVDGNPAPSEFTVGDTVTIESIVRNIGDGAAGRSDLAYYLGSASGRRLDTGRVGSLDPGDTDNNSESYTFVDDDVGTQYFTIVIDFDSEVDELDESNNTAVIGPFTVNPLPLPDLVLESVSLKGSPQPSNFTVGNTMTIHVRITNSGPGSASGFELAYHAGDSIRSKVFHTEKLQGIGSRATIDQSATYTFTEDDIGTRRFWLIVDHLSEVNESDESNNSLEWVVHVSPSTQQPSKVVDIRCSLSEVNAGETITCHPHFSGTGRIVYRFYWQALDGSPAYGRNQDFSTTWQTAGPKQVLLQTCAGEACSTHKHQLNVNEPPPESGLVIKGLGCDSGFVNVGDHVSCHPTFSAGGPVDYTWRAPGGRTTHGDSRSFHTSWASPGEHYVLLKICRSDRPDVCDIDEHLVHVSDGSPATAHVNITHVYGASLRVRIGVGDPKNPRWSQTIDDQLTSGGSNLSLELDLSTATEFLPPGPQNPWYVEILDTVEVQDDTDSIEGYLYGFHIVLPGGPVYSSTGKPAPLYDHTPTIVTIDSVSDSRGTTADIELRTIERGVTLNGALAVLDDPETMTESNRDELIVIAVGDIQSQFERDLKADSNVMPLVMEISDLTREMGVDPAEATADFLFGAACGEWCFNEEEITEKYDGRTSSPFYTVGWFSAGFVPGVDIVTDGRDFVAAVWSGSASDIFFNTIGLVPNGLCPAVCDVGQLGNQFKRVAKRAATAVPLLRIMRKLPVLNRAVPHLVLIRYKTIHSSKKWGFLDGVYDGAPTRLRSRLTVVSDKEFDELLEGMVDPKGLAKKLKPLDPKSKDITYLGLEDLGPLDLAKAEELIEKTGFFSKQIDIGSRSKQLGILRVLDTGTKRYNQSDVTKLNVQVFDKSPQRKTLGDIDLEVTKDHQSKYIEVGPGLKRERTEGITDEDLRGLNTKLEMFKRIGESKDIAGKDIPAPTSVVFEFYGEAHGDIAAVLKKSGFVKKEGIEVLLRKLGITKGGETWKIDFKKLTRTERPGTVGQTYAIHGILIE